MIVHFSKYLISTVKQLLNGLIRQVKKSSFSGCFKTVIWGIESYRSAFCASVRFALVWFCLFPLPLGVWEGCGLSLCHSLDFSLTFFASRDRGNRITSSKRK